MRELSYRETVAALRSALAEAMLLTGPSTGGRRGHAVQLREAHATIGRRCAELGVTTDDFGGEPEARRAEVETADGRCSYGCWQVALYSDPSPVAPFYSGSVQVWADDLAQARERALREVARVHGERAFVVERVMFIGC
jgi:hypothetical protein